MYIYARYARCASQAAEWCEMACSDLATKAGDNRHTHIPSYIFSHVTPHIHLRRQNYAVCSVIWPWRTHLTVLLLGLLPVAPTS